MSIILFIAGVIFAIVEVLVSGLFFIWLAIGFFTAAFVSLFTDNPLIIAGSGIVVAIISAALLRKQFIKKYKTPDEVKTSFESLVGRTATVQDEITIDPQSFGRVKIDGVVWNARSEDEELISTGTFVEIKKVDGSHLIVSSKK